MNFNPESALELAWLVFLGYWLIARFSVNRMARPEPSGTLILRILIMARAYALLFQQDPRYGILNRRFIYPAHLGWRRVRDLGPLAPRKILERHGRSPRGSSEGHQLTRSGPYANIRHPIYTGMLTALGGTTVAVGRYRALLVAFALMLLGFIAKSRQQEKLLHAQFGPAFQEHRRDTGFFLPRRS
jgi:hypothetical protein